MKQKSLLFAVIFSVFFTGSFSSADEFAVDSIKNISKRCARYRMNRGVNNLETSIYPGWQTNWDIGAYMTGVMALYRLTAEKWVLDSATKWSNNANWTASGGINADGDPQCCEQTFCEIYLLNNNTADLNKMVKPTFDNMKNLFDVKRSTGRQRWWWSDALYMAPASMSRCYLAYKNVTGSNVARLLDTMGVYWKDCAAFLYNTQYKLWWRDGGYKSARTSNGNPVFWSGCNAWAIAGLARVLQDLPAGHKDLPYYVQQFKDVCGALRTAPALGSDGLWRTSLLDYNQFPDKESIASAFFGFAYAWGINNGLLDRTTYEPYVRKTWSALVKNIGSDGRLQWSQGVSSGPGGVSQSFSAAEGEGAFCLMAEELIKMLYPTSVNPAMRADARGYGSLRLVSTNGKISVTGRVLNGPPLELVDLQGRMAGRIVAAGAISLPAGFYAVKHGAGITNVK